MKETKIYLGKNEVPGKDKKVSGEFVTIGEERFYKICNNDEMTDFFISLISNSDHWMFISSNGSLSAGRKNRDNALFPYYTVDKIHDYKNITGSKSIFLISRDQKKHIWEPFTDISNSIYHIERNIYKSVFGNKIIFEEINFDLEVSFQYGWNTSEKYGFVKKSEFKNRNKNALKVAVLDGIQNILPAGADYNFQIEFSNLLDAYKKNELIEKTGVGLFSLSSIPVDRAEPSESLYANTVWSIGLTKPRILISDNQVDLFKKGGKPETEMDVRARRGSYYVNTEVELAKGEERSWMIVAEINQDSADVVDLHHWILETENIKNLVDSDIQEGTERLKKIASSADGMQKTETELCYVRHFSNTLYNTMRGGVFADNYLVDAADYRDYVSQINKIIYKEFSLWLEEIPDKISYTDLVQRAEVNGDADLIRITYEYLPLTFSRRHGDPSRPWNLFSIETRNDDGSVKYNYEGNWRDIFQNWEALCYSFPEFIEGIISKFVNATTIDGYNPYRIMRDGIDWEAPDPDDPWAYIGYWGDHQIIYLQKLLELSNDFHPGKLDQLLTKEIFTYANVPYKIKSYQEIIQNPKDTIIFDKKRNTMILAKEEFVGADAKFLNSREVDRAYKANLMEKILVTLLSKLSNFIPEAGIWLNTQRPEWNDANNALVGNGTSMVTLYYVRRFLKFWLDKLDTLSTTEFDISHEVLLLFEDIFTVFKDNLKLVSKGFSDTDRRMISENLGKAHEKYRNHVYESSFHGRKRNLGVKELQEFLEIGLQYADQSIKVNQREDGLYHAYNLISISQSRTSIRHLYEMLEGQVAILSSGYLSTTESLQLLDALKSSKMFRTDQYSYMLYPDRQLPRFTEKNVIPPERLEESDLLKELLNKKDGSIINVDRAGNYHFNSDFRNAEILERAIESLDRERYGDLIEKEKENLLEIYEEIFDHQSFTGRSGTFFGYEGLGSIYWHMVSKLLLAVQESYFRAVEEQTDSKLLHRLKQHYYEIKAGIGLYKSPELYGAFPTDAYSHTPGNAGVKQPGLTGQVKEDVISRLGELGLQIIDGMVVFNPSLINKDEILKQNTNFEFYNLNGETETLKLEKDQIGFTFCQIPMLIKFNCEDKIEITFSDNKKLSINGLKIDREYSEQIFSRSNTIRKVEFFTSEQ